MQHPEGARVAKGTSDYPACLRQTKFLQTAYASIQDPNYSTLLSYVGDVAPSLVGGVVPIIVVVHKGRRYTKARYAPAGASSRDRSNRLTTIAPTLSPSTLVEVRNMSRNASTAKINGI